jgi:hypothetical protein
MKKIGIIGSGPVGQSLAKGFLKYNYPVMIGSRSIQKQTDLQKDLGDSVQAGSFTETASYGEILILAVKGIIASDALHTIGPSVLKDKVIIDTTNPIADAPPENGVLKFFTNLDESLMENLQNSFPDSKFVKAFSCIGSHSMVNPHFDGGQRPTMFICGNDNIAKMEVKHITDLFGFDTEDMGGTEAARAIEPLCMLWCIPGFKSNSWGHAFKLLK